jgi:hypothetical protein
VTVRAAHTVAMTVPTADEKKLSKSPDAVELISMKLRLLTTFQTT